MKKEHILTGMLLLAAAGLLAGCGGTASAAEVTEVPVVASDAAGTVVAEAIIEPARSEELSFEMGGTVVEVLVEDGRLILRGEKRHERESGKDENVYVRETYHGRFERSFTLPEGVQIDASDQTQIAAELAAQIAIVHSIYVDFAGPEAIEARP